ncbi:MAG: hypothetical protein ABH887_02235, partial [bacterium]
MNILVIEDNQKHTEDAKNFFETQDVTVTYVSNYSDTREIMFKFNQETFKHDVNKDIDGVISDIYFPLTDNPQWNQPEPIGVRVAVELSQLRVPFVLNTAGYHHGRKYEWIHSFAQKQKWSLIDTGEDYESDS